jgi:ATP-dependent helicase/nuclease subunit B
MRSIEGHHDFSVLESRLAALVREVKERDPAGAFAPVAIVAPTRRLIGHLQVRLAEAFPGLLNLHFFHHDSLARAAAAAAGAPSPAVLSDGAREALIERIVARAGGDLAAYVASRPGSLASLRSTVDDLREAVVALSTASAPPALGARGREVLRVATEYARALQSLEGRGLTDRTGCLRAALPHLEAFGRRFRLLVHYGAYDLIGANLDLMRPLEGSGVRIVYLAPFHPASPAFAAARRFWPEMLRDEVAVIDGRSAGRILGDRLPLLYDETSIPPALDEGRVAFFHAQGSAAELREVALRILALHRDHGVPLGRIGVVARSLEPYAPLLRPVFAAHGLPFVTSAALGAPREARAQAALHLARAALGDFERQPLMDLFKSGLFLHEDPDLSREAHAWDLLSREWRVVRGRSAWTRDLPVWVEEWEPHLPGDADDEASARAAALKEARRRQARGLVTAVERLWRAARPVLKADGWSVWAGAMEALCGDLLDGFGDDAQSDAGAGAVLEVLSGMRDLEAAGLPFSGPAALARFERALRGAAVPIGPVAADGSPATGDNGGVRILDAMQARGLAFDALFLVGLNADLFPRRAREDPFLSDDDRRLLRAAQSRPLPIKSAGREEERLLLAHLLGSARRWLTVSWQRADESGRARVPSLALREIARVTLGAADLGRVEEAARRIATHPAEAGKEAVERLGLLPPREARLNVALQSGSPRRLVEALPVLPSSPTSGDREALAAGLRLLQIIEDDSAADLGYDAFVGGAWPAPPVWSPSRLEALGACPQYFFFRHALHAQELAGPLAGYELEAADLGLRVHQVLHDVYSGLVEAGDLPGAPGDPAPAVRRAEGLARAAWERHTRSLAARLRPFYPLLWETTSETWLGALLGFLRRDVADLARAGAQVIGLEKVARAEILCGEPPRPLAIHGRFDRVCLRERQEVVVSDYKTSGSLEGHVHLAGLLKANRLQMPLYVLMAGSLLADWSVAGARVRAEVLGVGPAFAPDAVPEDETRADLDPEDFDRHRRGIEETVAVLLDLAAAGAFPLNAGSRLCPSCPYVRACRKAHAPTLERLEKAGSAAAYAALSGKSTRAPLLSAASRPEAEGEK